MHGASPTLEESSLPGKHFPWGTFSCLLLSYRQSPAEASMSRTPRKDPSHPGHNSTGGALPGLCVMLENGRANGRRWRLSAGFLIQAALLALVGALGGSLPLFHTEPLRATAPKPDGPIYIVPVRAGQPTGTPAGSGTGAPTTPRPPRPADTWPKIVFPTDNAIPTGDVSAPDVGPGNGYGPAGLGIPGGSGDGVPWGTGPSVKPLPPAGPIRLGGRLRAPRLLRRVEPDYPLLAQRAG